MRGIDISSNNHNGEPFNFLQVKEAGYDVVYVKATQGINYTNPYLIADVRDAANNGLLVGVYHYYQPSSGTGAQQADFFIRNGLQQPVGDAGGTLLDFLTLLPVLDLEEGLNTGAVNLAVTRDNFLARMNVGGYHCGIYMNRNYRDNVGYGQLSAFGWLAWPGWTTEPLPSVTAIVQTGQTQVQGIGESPTGGHSACDINEVLDITAILDKATSPTTTTGEDEVDSLITDINGQPHLVSHVYTSNGHYIEVSRPVPNVGKAATPGDSVIDLTDAYPTIQWH